jgi:hypothetical protein
MIDWSTCRARDADRVGADLATEGPVLGKYAAAYDDDEGRVAGRLAR